MSSPCEKDAIIDELKTGFTRLEQRDEFKDILLNELKSAIDKIGVHMEKQTESMQQIVVQKNDIKYLQREQLESRTLIDKLFRELRALSQVITDHKLEPVEDGRKIKVGTVQTIINAAISAIISGIVAALVIVNSIGQS